MPDLELVLRGAKLEGVAEELARAVGEPDIRLTTRPLEGEARGDQKTVDPVALASLGVALASFAVSIPAAALAVWDLAERIRKRSRAKALVEAATRLRAERGIEVFAATAQGQKLLADLDPDAILDLVNSSEDATK
jgi:hypothetical protein